MSSPGFFNSEDQEAFDAAKRRQAYAQALMQQGGSDPGNGQYAGLRNAGNSLLGAFLSKKADTSERDIAKGAQAKYIQSLGQFLTGNQPPAPAAAPSVPQMPMGGPSQPPAPQPPPQPSPQISNMPGTGPQMPTQTPQNSGTPGIPASSQATAGSAMPSAGTPPNASTDQLQRLIATGNPALIQQFAPELFKNQLNRDNTVWENQQPLSVAKRQESDLDLQKSEALEKYKNGMPLTASENATLGIQRGQLGVAQGNLAETRRYHNQMSGLGMGENGAPSPVVQSYVSNIQSGNINMQNVPQALRGAVSMQLSASPNSFSPTAATKNTLAASRITHPYTNMAAYKLTADGLPYLQRIDAAMKTPGSVSDQDMLDSLTKLNTGGNAVTDAQIKLITDGKSFSDFAGTLGNKFKNGGVLSDNQRQQIKEIANHIFDNYRKGYQPVYEKAASQLQEAGIPKQFWTIPDLNSLNAGQSIGSISPASQAGSQQSGRKVIKFGDLP